MKIALSDMITVPTILLSQRAVQAIESLGTAADAVAVYAAGVDRDANGVFTPAQAREVAKLLEDVRRLACRARSALRKLPVAIELDLALAEDDADVGFAYDPETGEYTESPTL